MRKHSTRIDPASTTSSPPAAPEISRRRFLFALSAGSAGAVAAAASPALAATDGVAANSDATASGYRETDHVRDYYATTRL
jgi:hypothetical protein